MMSIASRLFLSASMVLTICLGSIGWVLQETYSDTARKALEDRLQNQLYSIIAATDLGKNGRMFMPEHLPEKKFYEKNSGSYAQIQSHDLAQLWRSPSAQDIHIPYVDNLGQGEMRYEVVRSSVGDELMTFNMGLAWLVNGKQEAFTFSVAESLYAHHQIIDNYKKNLWTWLVSGGVIFVIFQALILRWSLAPLRRVAEDLSAIEQGQKSQLEGVYPKEISGLTNNLNAFVRSEREHIARYRNSLNDLAHSLKTPLAVLRNEFESTATPKKLKFLLQEQVDRMQQMVDYQLQKAASVGRTTLAAPVSMDMQTRRIIHSIEKVYRDKKVDVHLDVSGDAVFKGDKGDVIEMLGNVIDNAFKWTKSYVHVEIKQIDTDIDRAKGMQRLSIVVEDDGPGVPEEKLREVLMRGVRADEQVQGHGIGLAVVRDIVQLYHGKLEIGRSRYGGARVALTLFS